jgi:hypothetical protein
MAMPNPTWSVARLATRYAHRSKVRSLESLIHTHIRIRKEPPSTALLRRFDEGSRATDRMQRPRARDTVKANVDIIVSTVRQFDPVMATHHPNRTPLLNGEGD